MTEGVSPTKIRLPYLRRFDEPTIILNPADVRIEICRVLFVMSNLMSSLKTLLKSRSVFGHIASSSSQRQKTFCGRFLVKENDAKPWNISRHGTYFARNGWII
jgi:hypothetical protein